MTHGGSNLFIYLLFHFINFVDLKWRGMKWVEILSKINEKNHQEIRCVRKPKNAGT